MSTSYKNLINNLRDYLLNNFNKVEINKDFNIDVVGFEKGYKKQRKIRKMKKYL